MSEPRKRILSRAAFTIFVLVPLFLLVEIPVFLAGLGLGTYVVYSNQLPAIPSLTSYQPKTVSKFFADDGTVIGVFYKQKRFVVDLAQIPPHVVNAFVAAEDKRFFQHPGVDWQGILRATVRYLQTGEKGQGGSTITMQVTRHFLLSKEKTFSRKIKEMILAGRLEKAWGKEKILYVFLNEIYLGESCHGVEAASRGYFDKPVEHLTVAEGAMIAGLAPSPARYNPFKSEESARRRQLYVLGRMLSVGFITEDQYNKAKEEKLVFRKEVVRPFDLVPDFAEAVRRYIVRKYGEEKLYNEGLKVFTTCRIDYQMKAQEALDRGLKELRERQKNLAIVNTVPMEEINELLRKRSVPNLTEGKVYQGVVIKVTRTKKKETELQVALSPRIRGLVKLDEAQASPYKVGHVLALRFDKFVDEAPVFSLDDNPTLQGALVSIENRTGYVRAIVGGASDEHFKFNRAIQAKRQPGSAFKPIIYSAALEWKSYSPATIIIDEPTEVELVSGDDWEPRNASGDFLGPLSFRRALELSRNICTVKILLDVQVDHAIDMARRMGISSPMGHNVSLSLGTSELTPFELTAAYTVFPNSGVFVKPVLVKRVEDRLGNVLEDNSALPLLDPSEIPRPTPREELKDGASIQQFDHSSGDEEEDSTVTESEDSFEDPSVPQPEVKDRQAKGPTQQGAEGSRVHAAMSPQTAYIMTSLLQGVVRQGTGSRLSQYIKRNDLAGKTGTTNKAADAWFVGFNPDVTTGVWVGFDEKRPLGRREEGARAALPIWGYYMKGILDKKPDREFPVPPEITFKEMLTYAGGRGEGLVPKRTREPVYSPFTGRTLVVHPLDAGHLTPYGVPDFSPSPFQPYAPGYPPVGPYQQPAPYPIYPVQPGTPVPLHPNDGRSPVTGAPQPSQGMWGPPPDPMWDGGPVPGRGAPQFGPPAGPSQPPGTVREPGSARMEAPAGHSSDPQPVQRGGPRPGPSPFFQ